MQDDSLKTKMIQLDQLHAQMAEEDYPQQILKNLKSKFAEVAGRKINSISHFITGDKSFDGLDLKNIADRKIFWYLFFGWAFGTLKRPECTLEPPYPLYSGEDVAGHPINCLRDLEPYETRKDSHLIKLDELKSFFEEQDIPLPASLFPEAAGPNLIFPCQPGTEWNDIKITITSHSTARITTPSGTKGFSYHELGFKNIIKEDSPNKLWGSLLLFAKCEGRVDGKVLKTLDQKDVNKFMDRTRHLNKKLKELFGIYDSIYLGHYKRHKAYITRFKIEDKRILERSKEPEKSMFDSEVESVEKYQPSQRTKIKPAE